MKQKLRFQGQFSTSKLNCVQKIISIFNIRLGCYFLLILKCKATLTSKIRNYHRPSGQFTKYKTFILKMNQSDLVSPGWILHSPPYTKTVVCKIV